MHVAEQMLQRSGTLLAHEVVRTRQERLVAMCVPIEGERVIWTEQPHREGKIEKKKKKKAKKMKAEDQFFFFFLIFLLFSYLASLRGGSVSA